MYYSEKSEIFLTLHTSGHVDPTGRPLIIRGSDVQIYVWILCTHVEEIISVET
jgi:hypothetical protein